VHEGTAVDEDWLAGVLSEQMPQSGTAESVERLRVLLSGWAQGFAERRADVLSGTMAEPRRGLHADEASSFLRAIDAGVAVVDDAGFVNLPTVRAKNPKGRYALFSKLGGGVSLNLEYVIQVGAVAELILDHEWPGERLDFERDEFDALGYRSDGSVGLAVEAKARATGSDSLEGLLRFWFRAEREPDTRLDNNAGRNLPNCAACVCQGRCTCGWLRTAPAGPFLPPSKQAESSLKQPLHRLGTSSSITRAEDPE
jgi:hypothetical protein